MIMSRRGIVTLMLFLILFVASVKKAPANWIALPPGSTNQLTKAMHDDWFVSNLGIGLGGVWLRAIILAAQMGLPF